MRGLAGMDSGLAAGEIAYGLFGEDELAVPGDAQAIVLALVVDQDFLIALE
jgi:hypothetical protein